MATYAEFPQPALEHGHRQSYGSQTGLPRFALPVLYAAMGLSIGTVLGITAGVLTTPVSASVASDDTSQASPAGTEFAASPSVSPAPKTNLQSAAVVPVAAETSKPAANSSQTTVNQTPASAKPAIPAVKEGYSAAAQTTPVQAPAAEKSPAHPLTAPAEQHRAKRFGYPINHSTHPSLASAIEGLQTLADNEPMGLGDDAKAPMLYTEGDFTVADYNAQAGTIETSDGRTIALGSTVSASGAMSWDDYRSDVHYRCGQDGNCTLTRSGAIALNARIV